MLAMKQSVKTRWVEALRSGDYIQSERRLRGDRGFCCLGVLCDLASKEDVGEWVNDGNGCWSFQIDGRSSISVLPQPVMEWSGLASFNPTIRSRKLSEWNDNQGANFKILADMIERDIIGVPA